MATKKTLSVALAVLNEERNLSACLASVKDIADEIVIVDGGSTDNTVAVAKRFTNKIIKTSNPLVFHINKEKALKACTGDWILQLDADEVVTDDLKTEILQTIKSGDNYNGYYIPRRNYFWGRWMKKGGQYPDHVIRLVRNGYAHFPSKTVHEQIEVTGNVGYLRNPMEHYSYRTLADYWRKADIYTSLSASEMKRDRIQKNLKSWFDYTVAKPWATFIALFFRHKGFLDGWRGLVFALFSSWHFPIAYRKFLQLLVTIFVLSIVLTTSVQAEYVLPYPSFMPGNKLYTLTRVIDTLKNYWYFGEIAQTKYHLGLADKYLVEAKTLFEYKQYLLATDALTRSNDQFSKLPPNTLTREAATKHIEVLSDLYKEVPHEFTWTPEKQEARKLVIGMQLESAIEQRLRIASPAAWQQ